jgi:ribonuclease P protein component
MGPPSTIRRTADFRRILREGRRLEGRVVTVFALGAEADVRAGFVARRSIGSAVARNRALRVLRAAWLEVAPDAAPAELVFVARPGLPRSKAAEVAGEIRALLSGAGMMSP